MRVCEIYSSRQGEGRLSGTPSVFVRASGCNLRCRWCDTPYASWSPEGEELAVEQIVEQVERISIKGSGVFDKSDSLAKSSQSRTPDPFISPRKHVVVTGGEPMLFAELVPLSRELRRRDYHVTIETAGTLFLPVECDLMSISPKMANSAPRDATGVSPAAARRHGQDAHGARARHERARHAPEVIRQLIARYDYQLKFVVERLDDCDEVDRYLAELPEVERARVLLMPEGTDPAVLAERARWLEPYCREHGLGYCPRRHIEWYGPGRGK